MRAASHAAAGRLAPLETLDYPYPPSAGEDCLRGSIARGELYAAIPQVGAPNLKALVPGMVRRAT